uniref:Uncharacterized protein n=1 Tax=Arundo donax TaxID=35708 RepID=A0A0A9GBB1_ARUDO
MAQRQIYLQSNLFQSQLTIINMTDYTRWEMRRDHACTLLINWIEIHGDQPLLVGIKIKRLIKILDSVVNWSSTSSIRAEAVSIHARPRRIL